MNEIVSISDKLLPYIIYKLSTPLKEDVVVVINNNVEAQNLYEGLKFLSQASVFLFPEWDISLYDSISPSQNLLNQRIKTLYKLYTEKNKKILITTTTALTQKLPSVNEIKNYPISITRNQIIQRDDLIKQLSDIGYSRESTTSSPLEFAVRGSVVDIQITSQKGFRINFFESKIESIKTFDPLTQLSKTQEDSIVIYPSSELILSEDNIKRFKNFLVNNLGSKTINSELISNLDQGIKPSGIEHFISKFYKELISVTDTLENPMVISLLPLENQITQQIKKITTLYNLKKSELSGLKSDRLDILLSPQQLLFDQDYFRNFKNITLISYKNKIPVKEINNLQNDSKSKNQTIIEHIIDLFNEVKLSQKNFIISSSSEGARTRLYKVLEDYNVPIIKIDSWPIKNFIPQICLIISPLNNSFSCEEYSLITEHDIFGRKTKKNKKIDKNKNFQNRHNFYLDSFIVHKDHGIGQFKGLETIQLSDSKHDCFKLLYRDNDKLFVPVENIDLLSNYSNESQDITLDKLGSAHWHTRKEKVQKKIREIAHQLLKIAAKRLIHKSEIIEAINSEYERFCETFPYIETDDQESTIDSIIADLKNDIPMDRLICGDAGVGKTEIALRAAFITIKSQNQITKRQVAFICPTTLLCKQHFNSAYTRFKEFNINIAQLSRFTPRKEIKKIIEGINDGSIDMVIGTHAILSKKINFKNLSLVIIDEEQHFGVSQKEHLKITKENINILTLSATPIPRTLQMSLTGIKELSLIKTSPLNRQKTKVFISKFNFEIALEAILREFHRNGQSFFVCPRIKDLEHIAPILKEALPNLRIIVAHGGMPNAELENKVSDFYEGKADLLISTSIVESGLDIPRANTIIIYKAEMFGLSQLYQLKGRVGRSNVESSAYLMISSNAYKDHTMKRLSILETTGDSGTGFIVSSHDMDIRGFGNLLGDEQSGNIREIGIELYQKMLSDTITSIKQNISEEQLQEQEESKDAQINLGIPVLIPEEYIPDFDLRISLYQKLASLKNEDQIELFAAEMIDRFGTLPEEFENLISIIKLKNLCKIHNIRKVEAGPKAIMIQFHNLNNISPEEFLTFVKESKANIKLRPDNKIVIQETIRNIQLIFKLINNLIRIMNL